MAFGRRRGTMVGLAVGALLTLRAAQAMAEGPQGSTLERYADVQRRHASEILNLPGVHGAQVGASRHDPHRLVIILLVAPGTSDEVKRGLPAEFEGAPVEILEKAPVEAR